MTKQVVFVPTGPGFIYTATGVQSPIAVADYAKLGASGTTEQLVPQQFDSTINSKGTMRDVQPKNIATSNATTATLDSFIIPSNTTLIITTVITAVKSDNSQGGAFIRSAAFRNNGGSVSLIGSVQDGGTFTDDAAWAATLDNSTTTIRIRVTGVAATDIQWTCVSSRLEVVY